MKRNDLLKLIKECYEEILNEDSSATTSAREREKQEKEQWLKAKKDATEAEIDDLRKATNLSETNLTDLEEMARIPTKYSIAPETDINKLTGTNKKVAEYLKDNPGSTKLEVAKGLGRKEQAGITPIINMLVDQGIVKDDGLTKQPVYKKPERLGTGLRGRKVTPEGARKRAIKSIYHKLMTGKEDEVNTEEREHVSDEEYAKLKELVSQGGIKRGRKPKIDGGEEPEMFYQGDEDEFSSGNDNFNDDEFETNKFYAPDEEIDELTDLINQKNKLLDALKHKRITLDQYKKQIGDIPQRIKRLQGDDSEVTGDDLYTESISKERLMQLANIK